MRTHASTRSRGAVSTGVVVLNAALVAPLLALIILGIVETALLMKDNVALSSLVREGGRAAESSLDSGSDRPGAVAPVAAAAVAHAGSSLPKGSITELWVYRADAAGFPAGEPAGTHFARCESDCVAYVWDAADGAFRYSGGRWDTADVDLCAGKVGVYVKARHSFLTAFVSRGIDISKHETFRFDAGTSAGCGVDGA